MDRYQSILSIVTQALLKHLGDEVDLIFRYGSTLRGNTHKYSDLDVSYVPTHATTWNSITILVADRLIDLYPMQWSSLESMARFENLSASVLLENQVIYQRDAAVGARFAGLAEQLRGLLLPEARPEMVRKALAFFQRAGYAFYQLQRQAQLGHTLGCLQQSQAILRTIFHCLAVCNQSLTDTRKPERVLALPRLPGDFQNLVDRLLHVDHPEELAQTCLELINSTYDFLLNEQRTVLHNKMTCSESFDSAYPELRRDLQGALLACEDNDRYALRTHLVSLYHEISRMLAQVDPGLEITDFNGLSDYAHDLYRLGFPPDADWSEPIDFNQLHQSLVNFDMQFQQFLVDRSVDLKKYDSVEQLAAALKRQ